MTVLTTKSDWLDFSPSGVRESANAYAALILIERAIIEGSGGPDNVPITKAGLRFIRYLLSLRTVDKYNHLPNFKNMDTIRDLARLFIYRCGDAAKALQSMQAIMRSTI